jgi:hypothetical protein
LTYAQKPCCGAAKAAARHERRSEIRSARKLLILFASGADAGAARHSQALDFSRATGAEQEPYQQSYPQARAAKTKSSGINDLLGISRAGLKHAA